MQDGDAYLGAFMNGFEFVLLAIRGRIQVEDLKPEDKKRLEAFLDEYSRIAEAYKSRQPDREALVIEGRVKAELAPTMSN